MKGWKERKDASDRILSLLIWGVAAVLGMRLWFQIAGKIQIAFGVWHIAHILWGGLMMLGCILLLVIFEGKTAKRWAMVLGGIGWGLFIDEAGKFLTKNNDYWFQPAIIFIYMSFVIIFLVYRVLEKKQEKYRKIKPSYWEAIIVRITKSTYNRIFKKKMVIAGLTGYSVYYAVDKIMDTVRILASNNKIGMVERFNRGYEIDGQGDGMMIILKIAVDLAVSVMFLGGIILIMNRKRGLGLKLYKNGLLVSILLASIFRFYFEQFSAVFGLILDMLVYSWIVYYYKEKRV